MRVVKLNAVVFTALLASAPHTHAAVLACAECHPAETAAFIASPMGRSIGSPLRTVPSGRVTQSESGSSINIVWVNGQMVHRVKEVGLQAAYPIMYQIGAGIVGHSYITRIGEYLFQSPVSYYRRYGWDVSPGFKDATVLDFDRQLGDRCLTCHSSSSRKTEADRLLQPITCERCHGDIQQHLSHPSRANIVNPARLPPRARDSICEQCHLEGVARVLNPGKSWHDFRAGEELETTLSVYVDDQKGPAAKAVSQAEQLALSRCVRVSSGKLWCGTCHNPHRETSRNRASELKSICTSCHTALSAASHPKNIVECTSCHMPRLSPKDVAHAASTDHRILAQPTKQEQAGSSDSIRAWHEPAAEIRQRNLGLAQLEAAALPRLQVLGDSGGRLLEELPPNERDNDPVVLAALGDVALSKGKVEESESLFKRATQLAPTHAEYMMYLGIALKQGGDSSGAAQSLQRAIELDPSLQRAYLELSALYAKQGKTREASDVLNRYLKLNPQSILVRSMLDSAR